MKLKASVCVFLLAGIVDLAVAKQDHIVVSFENFNNNEEVTNGYKGLRWGNLYAGSPNASTSVQPAAGKNFAYTPYPPSGYAVLAADSADKTITLKGFSYGCTLGRFLGPYNPPPAPLPPIDYGARSVECEVNVNGILCAGQGNSAQTAVDMGGVFTSKNVTFMGSYSGLENIITGCSAYIFRVKRFAKSEEALQPILLLDKISLILDN